jgi:hypothetical protein
MRSLLTKIVYKGISIKEYASITTGSTVSEKVSLKINGSVINVSQNHWVLCLRPIVFGVWLNKAADFVPSPTTNYAIIVEEIVPAKKLAEIQLSFLSSIEEKDGMLLLLKENKSKVFHTSQMEAGLLYYAYYRKPGFSFEKFSSYVAAFSYPRKVRIVSFQNDNYYNIFPMDFIGKIEGTNRYVFGLRHTNLALDKIIAAKKIVVSEVPARYKGEIYKLGNYHSSSTPPLDELPFKTLTSKSFGFPVPEWAEKYNEIHITQTMNLGSHMLLWGESQTEEVINPSLGNLYHIHFLLALFQQRQGLGYTGV